jgi:exosortase A-associated hydrolase 2
LTIVQRAFYLPVAGGECFCVSRFRSDMPVRAAILHLPAFGDEMNKARAMTARAAREFARRGNAVLQIDLPGCGDSSGEHGDANLTTWTDALRIAVDRLHDQYRGLPIWLWCLRTGALLVPPLLERATPDAPLLLWQPVLSGAQYLSHLLRQQLASTLLGSSGERAGTSALRQRIAAGERIEIGGYAISPQLANELERATFEIPAGHRGPVLWLEVMATETPRLAPASQSRIERARSEGANVVARALSGPTFWQSLEIERCDELIDASAVAIDREDVGASSGNAAIL